MDNEVFELCDALKEHPCWRGYAIRARTIDPKDSVGAGLLD